MSSSSKTSAGGGIELSTLLITAVASACAAYVTSVVWAPGTLASAALTPVLVALIKEALERTNGNRTRAAKVLDLSHRALLYKIREYGLE